jgi:MFS family permease
MKSQQNSSGNVNNQRTTAYHFITLMGIVSLFGDMTYEGARSITGPYLAVLGASAGIVGFVAGVGEFIGYALRLFTGHFADRARAYWLFTFAGYGLVLSIPLMALAGYWQLAALLIILERMGKAVRTPARDAILSHATKQVGRGWGFALHEALDQVGGIVGPLIFYAIFLLKGSYSEGFTILWIPSLLMLGFLVIARIKVPASEKLEIPEGKGPYGKQEKRKLPRIFWLYTTFTFLSVAGFSHFQIISYHFKTQAIVPDTYIPVFYAIAMGVDGLVALITGKLYDRVGLRSLIIIPVMTLPIPFLAFSHSYNLAFGGIVLWGAVMGIHETIMRAAIADLTPIERRGGAYGIFNALYGAAWFIGSTTMGFLYDRSISQLIIFVVLAEVIALSSFFLLRIGKFSLNETAGR